MKFSVVVATHSFAFGTSQGLKAYLERKKAPHYFIQHRLFGNPLTWFIGMIDTFWKVISQKELFEIFIGSNRLNAFVGIWLKKFGKVKKVVYFSPDWVEDRFKGNRLLNSLYQWLDYYCVTHADITWNSSTIMDLDPMMQQRLRAGYPEVLLKKQIQVPDGTDEFPEIPLSQVDRYRLGFIGHLRKGMGAALIVKAFPLIQKALPKISCIIIGSGAEENHWRRMAHNSGIEFSGFMGDIQEVYKTLSKCAVALAPYRNTKDNMSQYTDPGKVKVYLSISLPVIITSVPKIAEEIHQKQAGLMIADNPTELVNAVIKLLTDQKMLTTFRHNAHLFSQKYSWNTIFDRALSLTLDYKNQASI